jgi:hypothetical protein
MTRKTYRTAQGKTVDLGALMLQNENTRAVGNMKVNARGDLIDGWNRPIDRRTQQVQKQYDRQVSNVKDGPVPSAASTESTKAKKPRTKEKEPAQTVPEAAGLAVVEAAASPSAEPEAPTGLAAAIARARQIKQEPIQSPQQQAKNKPGVTKI